MAPGGDVTATVPLQNCTSSECAGALTPVAEFVARIKALKAAPDSEIFLGRSPGRRRRTGAVEGAVTHPTPDRGRCRAFLHGADTSFADPGVRVAQAVGAFGANGVTSSICDTNFGPGLQQIATRIGTLLTNGGGSGGSGRGDSDLRRRGSGGVAAGGRWQR